MWDTAAEYQSWRNDVALANYVPGPLNPPDFYEDDCPCAKAGEWQPDCPSCGDREDPLEEPEEQITEADVEEDAS